MKVLVTGSTGFIGGHLVDTLTSQNIEVIAPQIDVTNRKLIRDFVCGNEFDACVHLAGISSVSACSADRSLAFKVNLESAYELGLALAEKGRETHLILPSTGQVYATKPFDEEHIYSESDVVLPRNFYGLTKYLAEEALRSIANQSAVSVTSLRIFNHSHKSQKPDFFLPSVYEQIIKGKEAGLMVVPVTVGSVDVWRDIGAIQDLVSALSKVIFQGPILQDEMNVFNVSSGSGKNLRDLILKLGKHIGCEVSCIEKAELVRTNEPRVIVASNKKFIDAYKWEPQFSVNEEVLIESFLTDLRGKK